VRGLPVDRQRERSRLLHDDCVDGGRPGRARRIEPAAQADADDGLASPDYASAFAADFPNADATSPEQWARITLEGAPRALRWFVLFGWKAVLRLRVEPPGAPGTVCGWRIRAITANAITLEVDSSLVVAHKVLEVSQDRLTFTTYVRYERTLGRILWAVIAPIHHLVEPLLLTMATSRVRKERAS
jgi:hypothetical protein